MPMKLRSKISRGKNARSSKSEGVGEANKKKPGNVRRSARLHTGPSTYEEDSDESVSEAESVPSPRQPRRKTETQKRPPSEMEEDQSAEEAAGEMELKDCTVVLDRLSADGEEKDEGEEEEEGEELEETEDMKRSGGKPVSRIPTFQKRPTGGSQGTSTPEPPVRRRETPLSSHLAPHLEKAPGKSVELSRSREDVRETTRPQTVIRTPKISFKGGSHLDQATPTGHGSSHIATPAHAPSHITTPKSWSVCDCSPVLVSTRPALRPEQTGSELLHSPRQPDKSKALETESHFPLDGSIDEKKPSGEAKESHGATHVTRRISDESCGDTRMTSTAEMLHPTETSKEESIINEEPPWEKEPVHILEPIHSRSTSDVECEVVDSPVKTSKGRDPGQKKELPETLLRQSEFTQIRERRVAAVTSTTSTAAPKKSAKAGSTKSTKSSGMGCCSFALFCLLPTTLLLLGGMGQHVWHYGLPTSAAQLSAQLQLHWLEGFGPAPEGCSADCRVHLVESIPVGLYQTSLSPRRSIADSWLHLLDRAHSSVDIAAFYVTLRGSDSDYAGSSDSQGKMVFEQLKQLQSKGVKLQIAVNAPQTSTQDTAELAAAGAEIREVDLKAVTGGIVHTKLWVVDQQHFYLGSANMDWRSLSQVKEVGLSVEDCSCLAQDASRIFGVYWTVNGSLPPLWPNRLSALSSSHNPLRLKFNGVPATVYLSSSPPQISARGRSDDLTTIIDVIGDAQEFIYISVMDFLPLSQCTEPHRFWPAIDLALRAAACTKATHIKLLVSCWKHSPASMFTFLQSLLVLNKPPLFCNIQVKIFRVPSTPEQMKIPYARVNHAKYMVTDRVVYIGTSNWQEDYFTQTAGVGLVVNQTDSELKYGQETLQSQAEELFLRDWDSQHASPLSVDDVDICPA